MLWGMHFVPAIPGIIMMSYSAQTSVVVTPLGSPTTGGGTVPVLSIGLGSVAGTF